jgi:uncharacterized damage-inducible protein DinB
VCSTFLEEIVERLEKLVSRGRLVGRTLSEQQLNWSPGAGMWTIGQIFEHMHIANDLYLAPMERAISTARFGGDGEVKHTWIGGLIIKAAGPEGNAPAPRKMVPGPGPYSASVVEQFVSDHEAVAHLARESMRADINSAKIGNPLFPLIKMNLADCFAIAAAHGERHMGQIEALTRRADFPN